MHLFNIHADKDPLLGGINGHGGAAGDVFSLTHPGTA